MPVKPKAAPVLAPKVAAPRKPTKLEPTAEGRPERAPKASAKPPVFKLPKTLAGCADLLYETRQRRLAADKSADAIKKEETLLTEHLINNLPKSQAGGISGAVAKVEIHKKEIPQVEDWSKFYAFIKRTGAFELLQRRVGDGAVKERWADKKEVPGVIKFTALTLSVTKR